MDNVTIALVVGLVFGSGLGAMFGLAIYRDRLRIVRLVSDETRKVLEKRLETARAELAAMWKEADDQAGYYRMELAKHEAARKGLDAEIDRISLVAVRAEARLLRMKHCQSCNDKLQHQTHCFSCGLHETVSETVRAVA